MNHALFATIFAAVFAAAPAAWAQDRPANGTEVATLRAAAKADKKALVASTIKLSDIEAKLLPLYDDYQRKLDALNRRVARLVEDVIAQSSKPLSDAMAKSSLLKESLAIEDEEVRARRGYQNRLVKVLPAAKVLRYLQLENKIRAIQDYDIATVMPLVN